MEMCTNVYLYQKYPCHRQTHTIATTAPTSVFIRFTSSLDSQGTLSWYVAPIHDSKVVAIKAAAVQATQSTGLVIISNFAPIAVNTIDPIIPAIVPIIFPNTFSNFKFHSWTQLIRYRVNTHTIEFYLQY